MPDPINDEILRIKHELAARHGNDVSLILADARAKQRDVVRLPHQNMSEQSDASKPPTSLVTGNPPAATQ